MSFSKSKSKPAAARPTSKPPAPENSETTFSLRAPVSSREIFLGDSLSARIDTHRSTSEVLAAETLPLILFSDFFFMAVVRLHHGGMKRARSQSMPYPAALPQAYLITRENAPMLGAFCWQWIKYKPMRLLGCIRRWKRVVVFPDRRRSAVR